MSKLTAQEAQTLLRQVVEALPHANCLTCECFAGYLMRLRLDTEPADREVFSEFRVERAAMHPCLGCEPCPPGDLYAARVRSSQPQNLITL